MTTLTQLIDYYCPDGVEHVKLGDVFDLGSGYTPSRKNTQYWENGSIPWFRMDDIRTNGRILSHSLEEITPEAVKGGRLFPGNSVMISTSATIGEHAIVTTDFMCNQRFHVLVPRAKFAERIHPRFAFYVGFPLGEYCRQHVNEGNFKTVSSAAFKAFPFPLPPREVQDAIVERLDAFTKLIESLDSEIALREKRFEYFREQLLTFNESDGVEYVKLGDVAEVGTGKCDRKNATDDGEYPFFVRSEQVLRYPTYQFDEEAIIVPGEGGIGEIFHYINGKYALHQRAYRVHFIDEGVSAKYALYAFKSFFKNYVMGRAVTATVTSLRKPMFTEFQFPLPALEVQQEVVVKLDMMQALIDNLKQERELRKTQFEYYREKLLTFNS